MQNPFDEPSDEEYEEEEEIEVVEEEEEEYEEEEEVEYEDEEEEDDLGDGEAEYVYEEEEEEEEEESEEEEEEEEDEDEEEEEEEEVPVAPVQPVKRSVTRRPKRVSVEEESPPPTSQVTDDYDMTGAGHGGKQRSKRVLANYRGKKSKSDEAVEGENAPVALTPAEKKVRSAAAAKRRQERERAEQERLNPPPPVSISNADGGEEDRKATSIASRRKNRLANVRKKEEPSSSAAAVAAADSEGDEEAAAAEPLSPEEEHEAYIKAIQLGPFKLAVPSFETRVEKKAYTVYEVKVEKGPLTWTVFRRFNDFKDLNGNLRKQFQTFHFPEFPGKSLFNNMSVEVIEKRREQLQSFLQVVIHDTYISSSNDMMEFLEARKYMDAAEKDLDLEELGSSLPMIAPPPLDPSFFLSNIIKSGYLLDQEHKFKNQWFVLTEHWLYHISDKLTVEKSLPLEGMTMVTLAPSAVKRAYGFRLESAEGQFVLCGSNAADVSDWMNAVARAQGQRNDRSDTGSLMARIKRQGDGRSIFYAGEAAPMTKAASEGKFALRIDCFGTHWSINRTYEEINGLYHRMVAQFPSKLLFPLIPSPRSKIKSADVHIMYQAVSCLLPELCMSAACSESKELQKFFEVNNIFRAVYQNSFQHVLFLETASVDLNAMDSNGATPLHHAVHLGFFDIAESLIKHGAHLDTQRQDGCTPLHTAVVGSQKDEVDLLLANGAVLDMQNAAGDSAAHIAVRTSQITFLQTFIQHKCSLHLQNGLGWSVMHEAVALESLEMLDMLVEAGADLDLQSIPLGETPLHLAVAKENDDVVALLIESGADLDKQDAKLQCPLHYVVDHNLPEALDMFLEAEANLNLQDEKGNSPLHLAVLRADLDMCKALVEHQANLNLQDCEGRSPLAIALTNKSGPILTYLIQQGTNTNLQDIHGQTCLHIACAAGYLPLVGMLLTAGSDINCTDDAGRTPLHYACANGHEKVAASLVEQGADLNMLDHASESALYLAAFKQYHGIVELMVESEALLQCTPEKISALAQAAGLRALYLLSQSADFETRLVTAQGLSVLARDVQLKNGFVDEKTLEVLVEWGDDESIPMQETCGTALLNLATGCTDALREAMAEHAVVSLCVDWLVSSSSDCQLLACRTLALLALNDANKARITQEGGMELLLDLSTKFDGEFQKFCLDAVAEMVLDDDNKQWFFQASGMAILVDLSKSPAVPVQMAGARIWERLCRHAESRKTIIDSEEGVASMLLLGNAQSTDVMNAIGKGLADLLGINCVNAEQKELFTRVFASNWGMFNKWARSGSAELGTSTLRIFLPMCGLFTKLPPGVAQPPDAHWELEETKFDQLLKLIKNIGSGKYDKTKDRALKVTNELLAMACRVQLRDLEQKEYLSQWGNVIKDMVSLVQSNRIDKQRIAARTSCGLARIFVGNRSIFVDSYGLPMLVNLAKIPDVEIQLHAASAFLILAREGESASKVVEDAALRCLVQLVMSSHPETKMRALRALHCVASVNHSTSNAVVNAGIIPTILLIARANNWRLKKQSMRLVLSLVSSQQNQVRILMDGGGDAILRVLDTWDIDTKRLCLTILYKLSQNGEIGSNLAKLNEIEIVATIAKDSEEDDVIRKMAEHVAKIVGVQG